MDGIVVEVLLAAGDSAGRSVENELAFAFTDNFNVCLIGSV